MGYTLEKFIEMIPLYANGELSGAEKNAFETAVEKHPELNRELMEFIEIRKSYNEIKEEAPTASDNLYARIMKNIKESEKTATPVSIKPRLIDQAMWSLKRLFATPQFSWSVVAVQLVIIIMFLAILPKDSGFKTLSENHIAQQDSPMINVVFKEDTREKDMRKLIDQINGSIINGPSPDGLYIITIKNSDDLDNALSELKNSSIVRLAIKRY